MERLVVPGVAPMALPMLFGGCAVVLAITAYHEGPDGRDKRARGGARADAVWGCGLVVDSTLGGPAASSGSSPPPDARFCLEAQPPRDLQRPRAGPA